MARKDIIRDYKKSWPATVIERRTLESLIPYARNARTHSDEQVAQIAASIKEWGWTNPVLIDEEGGVIAGHGRLMAARKLGIAEIPCIVARGWTDAQKKAYVLADNQLALNAGWDMDLLKVELGELQGLDFDLDLIGFEASYLSDLLSNDEEGDPSLSDNYSRKIEAPIYEVTGDCPLVSALLDDTKALELKAEIAKADNLPADVKAFLVSAAERHVVFNYRNIAEFYAHADAATQRLMERSALVIIDFNAAIENGFVRLSEGMMEQAELAKNEMQARDAA